MGEEFQAAARDIGFLDLLLNDVLSGVVMVFMLAVLTRCLMRALFFSWFGKNNGSIVSSLIEAVTLLGIVSAAWRNPGVLYTGIAWGALIFKSILR